MIFVFLHFILLLTTSQCQEDEPIFSKFSDTIQIGLKLASTYLNSEPATVFPSIIKKLNDITVQSNKENEQYEFILTFLRILGVDSSKLEYYALNGFISVTQLISEVFVNNETSNRKLRSASDFSPVRFIMNSSRVSGMISQILDPNLTDLILKEAEDRLDGYSSDDADCIKLLLCKTSPFVRGMQRSLRFFMRRDKIKEVRGREVRRSNAGICKSRRLLNENTEETCSEDDEEVLWEQSNLEDRLFFFTPSLDEVITYGDKCDGRFPNCIY